MGVKCGHEVGTKIAPVTHQRAYADYVGIDLFPCDDCEHEFYCFQHKKTCASYRHWENYGKVLKKNGVPVAQEPDKDLL